MPPAHPLLLVCLLVPSARCWREECVLTTIERIEGTLGALVGRLEDLDPGYRAMLPARRTLEAHCSDLGVMYHAEWRNGELGPLCEGPAPHAHIRIELTSTDLDQLASGALDFREAYASQRVRIDASMPDLLRLRAVL